MPFSLCSMLLTIILTITLFITKSTQLQTIQPFPITNFQFRQQYTSQQYNTTIPSTLALDLMKAGQVSINPYFRDNFLEFYRYQTRNFIYTANFNNPSQFTSQIKQLIFEGLDTHCQVLLNNISILKAHNMFRTYRVNVTNWVSNNNNLTIIFNSSANYDLDKQKQFQQKYGWKLPANYSFTRKAAYQYGWDWGPRILTMGIWKPIYYVDGYNIMIDSLRVQMQKPITSKNMKELEFRVIAHLAQTSINLHKAYKIMLTLTAKGNINVLLENGTYAFNQSSYIFNQKYKFDNTSAIKNLTNLIWWTWDLGDPNLFNLTLKIFQINKQSQTTVQKSIQTGFRTVKVKCEDNKQFIINLNGYDLYIRGGNYIPPEMSMPAVTSKTYQNIINDALFAKFNMLRIWGGGQFQNSQFYQTMDKHGVLIWHDLMFACAMYPVMSSDGDQYLSNIEHEMIDNLKRLAHHPSIGLWNGNNQVWIGWQQWGWKKGLNKTQIQQAQEMYRKIFNETLPKTIEQITPDIFYWQTSPSSSSNFPSTINQGDIHFWRVWGAGKPIEQYQVYIGRFNSQYGMQSMPEYSSIIQFTSQYDRQINSQILRLHQRHPLGDKYLPQYTTNYSGSTTNLRRYAYYSQVMQAYALEMAIVALRGNKPYNMGSIYWQMNDVWPVSSWATVDYYGIYKAAHYRVRQAYSQLLIHVLHTPENKNISTDQSYKVVAVNDYDKPISLFILIKYMDFNGSVLQTFQSQKTVQPFDNLVIMRMNVSILQKNRTYVYIYSRSSAIPTDTHQNRYYFVAPVDRQVRDPNLTLTQFTANNSIKIKANNYLANYVWIRSKSDEQGLNFQKNYFDLNQGQQIIVRMPNGVKVGEVEVSCYQSQVLKEANERKQAKWREIKMEKDGRSGDKKIVIYGDQQVIDNKQKEKQKQKDTEKDNINTKDNIKQNKPNKIIVVQ